MFSFNFKKVNFDKSIGQGAWGAIYPYQKSPDDNKWVVKHLVTSKIDDMLKHLNEIVLGFSCDHPNVLPIKGYHINFGPEQKNWNIYLKMERMKNGSLKDKIYSLAKTNTLLSEKEVIQYFFEISSGLAYLHNRKITHKDIKPDNILIDSEGNLKIADIGIGELLEGETLYNVLERAGTTSYSAPEILDDRIQLVKADLLKADAWSLGVVMAEICLMKFKPVGAHLLGVAKETEFHKQLDEVKGRYGVELVELIKCLLRSDRNERKTVEEVNFILKKKYAGILNLETQGKPVINPIEEEKVDDNLPVPPLSLFNKKLEEKWSKIFELSFPENVKRLEALACPAIKLSETDIKRFVDDIAENQRETAREFDELFMILRGCKDLNDECTKVLSRRISTDLRNLKTLKLYFTLCSRITDISVQALISDIGLNFKSLTALGLGFSGCRQLSDKTVQALAVQLKTNLAHLTSLDLFFNFCDKISESSLKELIASFPSSLKWLNLHLGGCKQISNQILHELSVQIKNNLNCITSLSLLFHECDKLTDEGAKDFILSTLSGLKSLKHFVINFEKCPLVTAQTNQFVGSLAVSVPRVSLCIKPPDNMFTMFF